jgi:hypothetical protein
MGYAPAHGLKFQWDMVIAHSDDEFRQDLLTALETGDALRNMLLLTVICSGWDGMSSPVSKTRKLKRTARRFGYHAIATIDSVSNRVQMPLGNVSTRYYWPVTTVIQESYVWLTPPSGAKPKGCLTEEESRLANAYCIVRGLGRDSVDYDVVQAVAQNYEELSPYLDFLRSSGDVTMDSIYRILDTKPELALAEGAL